MIPFSKEHSACLEKEVTIPLDYIRLPYAWMVIIIEFLHRADMFSKVRWYVLHQKYRHSRDD